jgi:hypothetical protein
VQEKGPSIFIAAPLATIKDAAMDALAEKRLGSPVVEQTQDGVVIYAEQSGLAAAVFNSYGGYGKVTISRAGASDNYSVSAITRSRVKNEPVGAQDALKGYNYNRPEVAIGILERIDQITRLKR